MCRWHCFKWESKRSSTARSSPRSYLKQCHRRIKTNCTATLSPDVERDSNSCFLWMNEEDRTKMPKQWGTQSWWAAELKDWSAVLVQFGISFHMSCVLNSSFQFIWAGSWTALFSLCCRFSSIYLFLQTPVKPAKFFYFFDWTLRSAHMNWKFIKY